MHVCRLAACTLCGGPLWEVTEQLVEPISGLLISETQCGACGAGFIGSRWPDGLRPRREDEDGDA